MLVLLPLPKVWHGEPRLSSGHMRLSVKCVPCRMSFIAISTLTLVAACERAANPRTGARDPVSLLRDAFVVGHVHESYCRCLGNSSATNGLLPV